ncbi:N-acetylmuramoyl-L-alanine amidase sle1 [Achaetomium macrosporum]|uniref:N-acetylmuramoyl-L-alanine amidase sle1 n=1 Tax=Achaetomium macrosporum TaxID=79813 RepID=A0AAN7H9U2_9PEZI|nr:N-acetylmuramoyl-L-alanine amidase sle1 [Achaetomium macrosporum]
MKLAILAAFFQAVAFSVTNAYPISGDGVNCRSGPGTSYAVKKTYPKGTEIKISCQTEGTSVNGNSIWDKTQDGCYVADYYVKTGTNGYVTDVCGSSGGGGGGSGNIPGPIKDDYPYKGSCGPEDKWNYFKCQCTSFVAWRINSRLGIKFHNQYKGVNWGNANSWDEAARKTGVKVDSTPKPGCIAQSNGGRAGHVAWVAAVGKDTVTIEEYNWNTVEGYGKRTVSKGSFNYIHLDSRV